MKKIILLFLFATCLTYGQKKQAVKTQPKPQYVVKVVEAEPTIKQYDFLKSVKDKYPAFHIPEKLTNMYVNNVLFQSEYSEEQKEGSYTLILHADNISIEYSMEIINQANYKGYYNKWGNVIVKTEIISDKEYNVYFDGKKEL